MLPQSLWPRAGWEAEGYLIPQTAPSHSRPRWGKACLGKEAKMGNYQICCRCRSVALGRECVPRSRGRQGGGAASLPSKRILLHTGPEATQPQTRTCTHQSRIQPVHRAKLPGPGTEPCWRWHRPVCTHISTPLLAGGGAERAGDGAVPFSEGQGHSRTSVLLAPDTQV